MKIYIKIVFILAISACKQSADTENNKEGSDTIDREYFIGQWSYQTRNEDRKRDVVEIYEGNIDFKDSGIASATHAFKVYSLENNILLLSFTTEASQTWEIRESKLHFTYNEGTIRNFLSKNPSVTQTTFEDMLSKAIGKTEAHYLNAIEPDTFESISSNGHVITYTRK